MTDVCPNIGPRQRRRRLIGGVAMLALAALAAACLVWFDVPRYWRVLVFLPAWGGALGIFQVAANTCVALAARGLKNMDSGDEAISDPRELQQVRAQSRRVYVRSLLLAGVVTVLIVFLPR